MMKPDERPVRGEEMSKGLHSNAEQMWFIDVSGIFVLQTF